MISKFVVIINLNQSILFNAETQHYKILIRLENRSIS